MGIIVGAGAGTNEVIHVVYGGLTDRPTVEAGCKSLGCALFHRKGGDNINNALLKSAQMWGWFDNDPH